MQGLSARSINMTVTLLAAILDSAVERELIAHEAVNLESVPLEDETLRGADCVVILVAHSGIDYARVVRFAPRVFDAVNATRGLPRNEHVERL